ncbi:MAG: type II toxin-antitoxin system VapC family toxin [Synergistaceae bacterium]|nr:type II toxin-antitoxin system VapC family toxin [Synergistaceae bacterium]
MKYLMDTCTFIWYVETSDKLPVAMRELIDNAEEISVSQVTFWEIAIKKTIGKLNFPMTSFDLEKKCDENKIGIFPLRSKYFERIQMLPLIHRDPFDRIIMATAVEEDLTLLTND